MLTFLAAVVAYGTEDPRARQIADRVLWVAAPALLVASVVAAVLYGGSL